MLTKENVMRFLPHRDPFLFIDTVESVELPCDPPKDLKDLLGTKVLATFEVKEDLEILRGHFPGNPILPGVVQIEMMAQASSFSIFKLFDDPYSGTLEVALVSANNSKFRKPIVPGMKLLIGSEVTRIRGAMLCNDCFIKHEDQVIAETSIMASARYSLN